MSQNFVTRTNRPRNKTKGVFLQMSKTTKINELAMSYQNETCDSLKQVIMSDLLVELKPWIISTAKRQTFSTLNGDVMEFESIIYETIWKALDGQAYATYDIEKGNFIGFLNNALKSPLGNHRKFLNRECRVATNEAFSLNNEVTDSESGNTLDSSNYGNIISDGTRDIGDIVCSGIDVFHLIDEFSASVENGDKKAKAICLAMYPEKYDNEDIAKALGFDTYCATARKSLQRAKDSFKRFASKRNFSLVTN